MSCNLFAFVVRSVGGQCSSWRTYSMAMCPSGTRGLWRTREKVSNMLLTVSLIVFTTGMFFCFLILCYLNLCYISIFILSYIRSFVRHLILLYEWWVVFRMAKAFNGDVSKWNVEQNTRMDLSTYPWWTYVHCDYSFSNCFFVFFLTFCCLWSTYSFIAHCLYILMVISVQKCLGIQ